MEFDSAFQKGFNLAKEGFQFFNEGDYNQSIQQTLLAIEEFAKSEHKEMIGKAFRQLGDAYEKINNWVGMLAAYQEAINWDNKLERYDGVIISQLKIFHTLLDMGETDKAVVSLKEARKNVENNPSIPNSEKFLAHIKGIQEEMKKKGIWEE